MKNGFTLIELLVVVLIIGILAAVALPQYEKAVWKSRFSNALQVGEGVRRASEVYFMANGQYVDDLFYLDVDYSNSCHVFSSHINCDNNFYIDLLRGGDADVMNGNLWIFSCSGSPDFTSCQSKADLVYKIYFAQSSAVEKNVCTPVTEKGKVLCKLITQR